MVVTSETHEKNKFGCICNRKHDHRYDQFSLHEIIVKVYAILTKGITKWISRICICNHFSVFVVSRYSQDPPQCFCSNLLRTNFFVLSTWFSCNILSAFLSVKRFVRNFVICYCYFQRYYLLIELQSQQEGLFITTLLIWLKSSLILKILDQTQLTCWK